MNYKCNEWQNRERRVVMREGRDIRVVEAKRGDNIVVAKRGTRVEMAERKRDKIAAA